MDSVCSTRLVARILQQIRLRTLAIALLGLFCAVAAAPSQAQNPHRPFNVLPLRINSVSAVTDASGVTSLVANGSLGSTTFTAPIDLSNAAVPTLSSSILDLHLGAINLNLLGLDVATSPICLDITAVPGPGNLLGNLLFGISGLLNNGLSLSQILNGLTTTQLTQLESGITGLLNGALSNATSSASFAGISGTAAGATDILNLSLGPVNLNLLGLNVHLDNCNNGPVTVDITAIPGAGNLLGNLLSLVAHLLDNTNASQTAILAILQQVAGVIAGLL